MWKEKLGKLQPKGTINWKVNVFLHLFLLCMWPRSKKQMNLLIYVNWTMYCSKFGHYMMEISLAHMTVCSFFKNTLEWFFNWFMASINPLTRSIQRISTLAEIFQLQHTWENRIWSRCKLCYGPKVIHIVYKRLWKIH